MEVTWLQLGLFNKNKKTSISWSPDKILYPGGENKTKCNRVWVRRKS